MSVINTNYLALVSQNNLTKSQNALGSAIERLSSGLRINSAKDDAAGQAIANRFTANIKGLTQAVRNANDGISIAQTTEGALNEINNNLQRVRELSVQAANGTNSPKDLESIQAEINQRMEEINRVSDQTQFNGIKVLAKDNNVLSIQVGANDKQTIDINLQAINSDTLGMLRFNVSGPKESATAVAAAKPLQDFLSNEGITATSVTAADTDVTITGFEDLGLADNAAAVAALAVVADKDGNLFAEITAVPADATRTGIDASNTKVYIALDSSNFDVAADGSTVALQGTLDVSKAAIGLRTDGTLADVDFALSKVDGMRSDLGAIQNRFQSTIANLSNTVNNLSAARSRIEDADYAVEVSNMTRAQILQQAGQSVLAQANQVPQGVLSLLR